MAIDLKSISNLFFFVAILFVTNVQAQDTVEIDESTLSKKELRQLHREQRKAERAAKREERKHLREEKHQEATNEPSINSSEKYENLSASEEVEQLVEDALTEHERSEAERTVSDDEYVLNYQDEEARTDEAEHENDELESESEGSSLQGFLIFGGLVLVALFFGKSEKGKAASKPAKGTSGSRPTPKPSAPQLNVYMCGACGLHVTQSKTPNATKSCINGKTHRWTNIGPAGNINYGCLHCDIIVQMAKTPRNTKTCVDGKLHSWRKL